MRYEDLQELGKNHYSVVYAAHDFNTHRDVVIMELLPQFQANPGRWNEIWQQVLTLSDAKLENTVPVFDLDRDRRWIVMEKMKTGLLTELAKGPIDPKTVRGILRQILVALDSLHKYDIAHGDIKPANLLVNNEGYVRLSFSPGLVMGGQIPQRHKDFKYLAPELLSPGIFGDVGPQSDLYCLGFTAMELLVGPQFDSKFKGVEADALSPDHAWMKWHSSNRPSEQIPSLAKLAPGMPQDLVKVIDKLLQKEVKSRYQSASEALGDLERTGQDPVIIPTGTGVPPIPSPPPSPPSPKKNTAKVNSGGWLRNLLASKSPSNKAPTDETQMQKINRYLEERPGLKYTVIGLVALVFLMLLFGPSGKGGNRTYAVEISSSPEKSSLTVERLDPPPAATKADKKADSKAEKKSESSTSPASTGEGPVTTPANLKLAAGDYLLHYELPGYEKLEQKITVKKSGWSKQKFAFTLKPVPPVPPSVLPDGLEAVAEAEKVDWTDKDGTKKLPKEATSARLGQLEAPMKFALIMPKTFSYGVKEKDQRQEGELPDTDVTLTIPYYISLTEVTNAQLQAWSKATKAELSPKWAQRLTDLGEEGPSHPAVHVGFSTATNFCVWLSKSGRLPSEKQWEYAARGTSGRLLPWESQSPPSDKLCNLMFGNGDPHTVPVTELAAGQSPLGLKHLVGNVAEWCSDEYDAGENEGTDVPGAKDFGQPYHTIRGGSFLSRSARLTTRANCDSDGAGHVGFRVIVLVQSSTPAATTPPSKAIAKPKAKTGD